MFQAMFWQQGLFELVVYFSSALWQKILKLGSYVLYILPGIYKIETNALQQQLEWWKVKLYRRKSSAASLTEVMYHQLILCF